MERMEFPEGQLETRRFLMVLEGLAVIAYIERMEGRKCMFTL